MKIKMDKKKKIDKIFLSNCFEKKKIFFNSLFDDLYLQILNYITH